MSEPHDRLKSAFPNLTLERFDITSCKDGRYNCIAWAANDSRRFWWPLPQHTSRYWPPGVPRSETVESFLAAFESIGYSRCRSSEFESGFVKVALYLDTSGKPTHMARQLGDGTWTSKLGPDVDICHETLAGVEGYHYGSAAIYMKRAER